MNVRQLRDAIAALPDDVPVILQDLEGRDFWPLAGADHGEDVAYRAGSPVHGEVVDPTDYSQAASLDGTEVPCLLLWPDGRGAAERAKGHPWLVEVARAAHRRIVDAERARDVVAYYAAVLAAIGAKVALADSVIGSVEATRVHPSGHSGGCISLRGSGGDPCDCGQTR